MKKRKVDRVAMKILMILVALALSTTLTLAEKQNLEYSQDVKTINLEYDGLGRVIQKTSNTDNITFNYDLQLLGTLHNITSSNFTKRFTYDDRLRITKEEKLIQSKWFTTSTSYDSMDRIVEKILPDKEELEYYYNEQGKIKNISGYITGANYNAFDNPLNRTYLNNKISNFSYDSENARLTQLETDGIQTLAYNYDNVGNILAIQDPVNDRDQNMSYDDLDRLINVTINNSNYSYSYNPIGNLMKIVRDDNATYFHYGDSPVHAPSQLIIDEKATNVQRSQDVGNGTRTRVREFYLINDKQEQITTTFTADFEDGSVTSNDINISDNVLVFVEHNYTNAGSHKVNITVSNGSDYDASISQSGPISNNLKVDSRQVTNVNFDWVVENDINESISADYDCGVDSGSKTLIVGSNTIDLSHNYTSGGSKVLNCNLTSDDGNISSNLSFEIPVISFQNYSSSVSKNTVTVNFEINNSYYGLDVNWSIVSDVEASGIESISQESKAEVSQSLTFNTGGYKNITVNISSNQYSDAYTEQIYLKSIEIEDYYVNNSTSPNKSVEFKLVNYWNAINDVVWNYTTLSDTINLAADESKLIQIKPNFTTQGVKTPVVTVTNNTIKTTLQDFFPVDMVKTYYYTLIESSTTISELMVRNNKHNDSFRWTFNNGSANIESTTPLNISEDEEVLVFIETDTAGVQNVSTFVNLTNFNDTTTWVII